MLWQYHVIRLCYVHQSHLPMSGVDTILTKLRFAQQPMAKAWAWASQGPRLKLHFWNQPYFNQWTQSTGMFACLKTPFYFWDQFLCQIFAAAERIQTKTFFDDSANSERPVRRKFPVSKNFIPTSFKNREVNGIFGDQVGYSTCRLISIADRKARKLRSKLGMRPPANFCHCDAGVSIQVTTVSTANLPCCGGRESWHY